MNAVSRCIFNFFLFFAALAPHENTHSSSSQMPGKHERRNSYFIESLLQAKPLFPYEFYEYVNPDLQGLEDLDPEFFEKILAIKSLNKSDKEKLALARVNKFLSTNYRTHTTPAEFYIGKDSLPSPFYLSELVSWTFGAIAGDDLEVLRVFLDNYNLLNIKDSEGNSLLLYAAKHGKHEIAEFLLKRGINPNAVDTNGVSALMIAARNNDLRALELLIKFKCSPLLKDKSGNSALDYALAGNSEEAKQYLATIKPPLRSR